tara:strand:- start:4500 stop:5069 length:570 start_codon:yes stop_codon:yes gene_type:complete
MFNAIKMKTIVNLFLFLTFFSGFAFQDLSTTEANQPTISDSYIKVTVNGATYVFNEKDYVIAQKGKLPDERYNVTISASNPDDNDGSSEVVSIILFDLKPIQEKTYSNGRFEELGYFGPLYIGVQLGFLSAKDNPLPMMNVTNINKPQATLILEELSEEHLKGTFEGQLYNPIDRTATIYIQGEFFVQF